MNPLDKPTLCPFCSKTVALSQHIGQCEPVQVEVADLSPEQVLEGLVEEAMKLFAFMVYTQTGEVPTPEQVASKRAQVTENIKRFGGLM